MTRGPEPLDVECPECMAEPYEECIEEQAAGDSYIEVLVVRPHAARLRAAEQARREKEEKNG